MQEVVACLAALGIGLSLGLIGAGGSILTIPVFVYVLKNRSIVIQYILDVCCGYFIAGRRYSIDHE